MADNQYIEGFDLNVILPEQTGRIHSHRDIELLYAIEGTSIVKVEDASYRLGPDHILLINAGKKHSIRRMTGSERGMLCCIHISERMLSGYVGQYRVFFFCNSTLDGTQDNYRELKGVINRLLVDYMGGKKERYFLRYSQCYSLLHLLVVFFLVTEKPSGSALTKSDAMDERYEDILHYIEMNYDSEITLTDLAEEFSLSLSYLSRYLKKKLGMSFTDYLYDVRMRYAVEELLFTSHPVTRLATDHGFPSASVFNSRFRARFHCTPTEYRSKVNGTVKDSGQRSKEEERFIREKLKEHFGISIREEVQAVSSAAVRIHADLEQYREYSPGWGAGICAGSASVLKYAEIRQALLFTKKELGISYVRIWNLFDEELHIIRDGRFGANSFARINEIIQFLLDNGMKPFLELGEKSPRILRSVESAVREPRNHTNFTDYGQFLSCLKALFRNFSVQFGRREVETWKIEIWEDMRVEIYPDKVPYLTLFQDCCRIIKNELPGIQIGGSGNHLGWYREHTQEAVRKWVKADVYPDFLTFNYYPYAAGVRYQEIFSKRKYDESDLLHTLDELGEILQEEHFPERRILITDWNMSISSRNFFNDSLWKGCYVLKCYLDSLGKADSLICGQLVDTTTDDVDSQTLINGSGGILTRDMIEKPAFVAMKMLSALRPRLLDIGDGYIVTGSEEKDLSVIFFNFINRNYLYYIKQEYENSPSDHYRYFENLEGRKYELELSGLAPGYEYIVRHDFINREHGSILDEWNSLSCIETPARDDIAYLKATCRPKKVLEYIKAEGGRIHLECTLKALEIRLITLERRRTMEKSSRSDTDVPV